MNKAVILLGILGSIFTLCIGVSEITIIALIGDDYGVAAAALAALIPVSIHTVASFFAYRRFRRKYGMSAWKFVVLNVLPALVIGALVFFAYQTMHKLNIAGYGENYKGLLEALMSIAVMGYSVVYAALLSAVLWIQHAVFKKKNRL